MKILVCLFLSLFLLAFSCNMSEDEDYYKLVIISYHDSFLGTYTTDTEIHIISISEIVNDGGIYTYSKGLGKLTSLDVDVAGASQTTSFLKVVLYQNEEKVASESTSPVSSLTPYTAYLSLTYSASEVNSSK